MTAVVCHVNDPSAVDKKNLVVLIKIPDSYVTGAIDKEQKWYLFNDVSICPVPAQEAVWFSLDWKIPCVLFYSSTEMANGITEILPAITKVCLIAKYYAEITQNSIDNCTDYFAVIVLINLMKFCCLISTRIWKIPFYLLLYCRKCSIKMLA